MMPSFKRETIVVVSLSIMFFFLAILNLGHDEIPSTGWAVSGRARVIIDLVSEVDVIEIAFMVKTGDLNLEISTGEPDSWDKAAEASVEGYNRWRRIGIDRRTRFLRLDFNNSQGEVLEIVVAGTDGRFEDLIIWGEDGPSEFLNALTNEQDLAQYPPTYMSESVFDEVYYVRAAEDYLSGRNPYEDTHPPLGKLIIAAGISVLGNNPFGWRVAGVFFASAMIPVIYLLGIEINGSRLGGLFSASLLGFDFMRFTMGKIATTDVFLVFFSLTSMLFFYRYMKGVLDEGWGTSLKPLFAAVILSALGFATKWTAAFGLASQFFILGLIRVGYVRKEKGQSRTGDINGNVLLVLTGTLAVFLFVYFLTYIPYLGLGHSLKDVFERQLTMFSYHSGLEASHGYASPWWSWPLLSRPVWLYVSELGSKWVSTLVAMGNPVVWWIGLIVMINEIRGITRGSALSRVFLVTMFAFQWLPYALISRSLFLYHFFPNVPILCLAISDRLLENWKGKKKRKKTVIYLLLVMAAFVFYYPVISGSPVHEVLRSILRILRSWVF
jgi:dolichyl-phosphate-mannose--protein O-mannosyl transferase